MVPITSYEDFLLHCRILAGKTLYTGTHHKAFGIELEGDTIWFVPQSSGKRRRCDPDKTTQVLAQFHNTGSDSPGSYQRITFHASYILAVVREAQAIKAVY